MNRLLTKENKILTNDGKLVSVEIENPLQKIIDGRKSASYLLSNYKEENADFLKDIDFSEATSLQEAFGNATNLKSFPKLNGLHNITTMYNAFIYSNLSDIPELSLDITKQVNIGRAFMQAQYLKKLPIPEGQKVGGNLKETCYGCARLEYIPYLDFEGGDLHYSFSGCSSLKDFRLKTTENVTDFYMAFNGCNSITDLSWLDTGKGKDFYYAFNACRKLTDITLNLDKATNISNILLNTVNLTNAKISNIRLSLQIGSGSTWGHLLTIESLIFCIQELIDTGSAKTLTIGTANMAKLSGTYVKLIPTDEDPNYIKLPFVVCESTDEGAMLITEYVQLKNWGLA